MLGLLTDGNKLIDAVRHRISSAVRLAIIVRSWTHDHEISIGHGPQDTF